MAGPVAPRDSSATREYLSAELPRPETPWREAIYSVIDLELTGLDPRSDEIIAFAAVTVRDGRVSLADVSYRLVKPEQMPEADTIRIHGLMESDLEDAAPLSEVIDEMLEALTGRAMVAHFAPVEEGFLRAALEAHGLELRNPVIDTVDLAAELALLKRQHPFARVAAREPAVPDSSPGLSNLARSLGLPIHRPHHADGDALTAAQVFLALATHLDELDPQTVGSLERISRTPARRRSLPRLLRSVKRRLFP